MDHPLCNGCYETLHVISSISIKASPTPISNGTNNIDQTLSISKSHLKIVNKMKLYQKLLDRSVFLYSFNIVPI